MYNKILVPLDGSKRAEVILPHVEQLAKHYNSEVVFMLVEEGPLLLGRDEVVDLSVYKQNLDKREKEMQK
jgi:nucleotide-binding universal stress UspA family protein